MKNTNKTIRRVSGIALSAVMLMSVAGTTLCEASSATVNEATADEVTVSARAQVNRAPDKVERLDEIEINDGRVYAPGSFNWFAISNTNDSQKTFIVVSGEDGQVSINVFDLEHNIVASVTGDMSEKENIKVEIPMNEDDGCFYFVNVSQDIENASTSDFSVMHISQTEQTHPGSGNGMIERLDVLKSHDGRVFTPGTSNWFAIRNTCDGKKTYITASGEDGQTTIDVFKVDDGEHVVIASETADLAETEMMKVEIPMNEEDGPFYFVNVYQTDETASTENYSINHLNQSYMDLIEATNIDFNETVAVKSRPATIENMDGTIKAINEVKDTMYFSTGAGNTYTFEVGAESDLEYSFIITDFDGNYVDDVCGTVKGGSADKITLTLEQNGSYFVHFSGSLLDEGEVAFGFGA